TDFPATFLSAPAASAPSFRGILLCLHCLRAPPPARYFLSVPPGGFQTLCALPSPKPFPEGQQCARSQNKPLRGRAKQTVEERNGGGGRGRYEHAEQHLVISNRLFVCLPG
ncbi:unnamed protein product, partial [Tuber aestivum]